MSKVLYQLFARLYPFAISLVSPFNSKARLWVKGRGKIFERMREIISSDDPLVWMHCASLGEFEQGRPLIEKIRAIYPSYKILLTFFSPSGYEVRKNYKGADYVFYLPADTHQNATEFLEITKPALILFVKYEFWYYYLNEAKMRNIPLLLVSGIFRKTQPFFKKYGNFYRSMLSSFTHFFVQNEESLTLLRSIGFTENVTIIGDTRFDRVIEIAQQFKPIEKIERFCSGFDVIVAGSTWSEDDKKLSEYGNSKSNLKFIIAPHSIASNRLDECLKLYKDSVLFSKMDSAETPSNINTVIVDNIGMLNRLYKYSTVSFVGGGFGKEGVHNVLEAAVYGKPVVFGPIYEKYIEAVELIDRGGAITVDNSAELREKFDELLKKDKNYIDISEAALNYIYHKQGATNRILQFIQILFR